MQRVIEGWGIRLGQDGGENFGVEPVGQGSGPDWGLEGELGGGVRMLVSVPLSWLRSTTASAASILLRSPFSTLPRITVLAVLEVVSDSEFWGIRRIALVVIRAKAIAGTQGFQVSGRLGS
ncbi:MAG: hypothetical protein MUF49_32080 [Oculatellaceae cyanobacterium Prado106]|nr:hypothetical protein [Oculatellaceae cyanobacterium Prado106]